MRVTQIIELSKTRSRVITDQGTEFVLYRGELRTFHIREEEEITPEAFREIMEEILPRRAKLRCMNLLKSREYTTAQLCQKLRQGFYPEEVIEEAIAYVASLHYIDDLRFARDYITYHEDKRSRKRIEQDLQNKGIDRETMRRAFAAWEEEGGGQDESSMIQTLLEKRHYDSETADRREQQRTYAFLMRKGFSSEAIRKAMNTVV